MRLRGKLFKLPTNFVFLNKWLCSSDMVFGNEGGRLRTELDRQTYKETEVLVAHFQTLVLRTQHRGVLRHLPKHHQRMLSLHGV